MHRADAIASSSSRSSSTASMSTAASASSSRDGAMSSASNKRKRSPQGCVVAENDVIVEELQKIKGKIRESSHLAGNYARAIISIQHHTERITSAREAKQLRNIGNYIANQIQSILQKHQIRSAGDAAAPSTTSVAPPTRPPPAVPSGSTERRPSTTSASAPAAPITSTATAAATTVMRRPYLPAEGKQPWYVLRVLKEEDASSEQSAVALSVLLSKMQAAGFDGTLPKLRVCITSLLNTHQIITKASGGGVYLNERGIRSAELCISPTAVPRANNTQDSGRSEIASVVTAEAQVSDSMESLAVRLSKRSAAVHRAATTTVTTSRHHERARQKTEMVCIDLSDSDADNYDSDTATIRATSMSPRSRRDLEQEEPDAEPSYSMSQRRLDTIANSADPSTALIREEDEWEIVLILDHREVLSRRNRDILERKLLEINVTCEVRSLNVGDVQWVARRYRGLESVEEFMLNVIVERKEVRDLSGSIIDRRYNEQKTRLRDSGMTHVIYLVEGSLTQQTTVRSSGLQTALCRTQVQNQFFVQQCQNADESVAFLRGVHMNLLSKLPATMKCRNRERGSTTPSRLASSAAPTMNDWTRQFCQPIRSYTDFNAQFRKKADFTVGEIYQMMLMQVHSLSSSRTVALSAQYPTFQYLAQAVARGEKLQDVRYGESQRRLGAKSHEFVKFLLESTDYERNTPTVGVSGALDN